MITLTKEWLLKTIAELEEERDAVPGIVNEDADKALAAMKIALASLEAEPVISHLGSKNALDAIVAFIKSNRNPTLKDYNEVSERLFQDNCHGLSNHVIEYIKQIGDELEELRSTQDTAPPAQEAPEVYNIGDATMRHIFTPAGITDVSDMQAVFDQIETVLAAMDDQGGVCCEVSYADGWNACRAAMLQAGNSPVTPDGSERFANSVERFGKFSAGLGEGGEIELSITLFHFGNGNIPEDKRKSTTPKFMFQGVINQLQKKCDEMTDEPLINLTELWFGDESKG